jgi:hypothetical protein
LQISDRHDFGTNFFLQNPHIAWLNLSCDSASACFPQDDRHVSVRSEPRRHVGTRCHREAKPVPQILDREACRSWDSVRNRMPVILRGGGGELGNLKP